MSTATIELPSSAITTWSGFLYQGQLAILHCMKLLEKQWDLKYSLQLDSLEDFAIVEVNADNIKPISMHQVKALKSQSYGSYTTAFEKLNKKVSQCNKLYFHIAREITNKSVSEIEADYPNIKIYEYCDGSFNCELGELQNRLEAVCKMIYSKHFTSEVYKQADEYVTKTLHYLTHIIIRAVIEVHKDTHDDVASDDQLAFNKTISFSEFRNIFEINLNEKGDNSEYYKTLVLEDFQRYYESYYYEYGDEISQLEMDKLDYYMIKIMKFTNQELETFIKGIIPHRKFKFITIQDYKDGGLQRDEMEDVFFAMLKEIRQGDIEPCQIQWKCQNGYCYCPTTINAAQKRVKNICARIIENGIDSDLALLYEGNTLITEHLNSDSILEDSRVVIEGHSVKKEHILRIKDLKLIDVTTAKEILNEK